MKPEFLKANKLTQTLFERFSNIFLKNKRECKLNSGRDRRL